MRIATVLLSLTIAAAAPLLATLPQEELRRGVLNLVYIEDLSYELRYQRAVRGRMTLPAGPILDPWGTAYRVEINGEAFRIIGAGSDCRFEPESWTTPGQYADLAIDVVADDDDITRSNHLWLNGLVPDRFQYLHAVDEALAANPGKPLDLVLTTPRLAGGYLAMVQDQAMLLGPKSLGILQAERTWTAMRQLAAQLDADLQAPSRPEDEWGTPLRVELDPAGGYRIISAGADRTFEPRSWALPMTADLADDQVYAGGKGFVRKFDRNQSIQRTVLEAARVTPPSPEPDEPRTVERAGITAYRQGGDVKLPEVTKRTAVPYPPEMREAKKVGSWVGEILIDERGKVRDVTVLVSPDPAFDRAIEKMLARWRFKPGTLHGKPVPVLVRVSHEFTMDNP